MKCSIAEILQYRVSSPVERVTSLPTRTVWKKPGSRLRGRDGFFVAQATRLLFFTMQAGRLRYKGKTGSLVVWAML
jgi:hypothetical protein